MVNLTQLPAPGSTTVQGTVGRDVLSGFTGNDILLGGDDNDLFFEGRSLWVGPSAPGLIHGQTYEFGTGSDTIDGGAGYDVLSYQGSKRAVVVDLDAAEIRHNGDVDHFVGIEGFFLTDGSDRVRGVVTDIALNLGNGNDTVSASVLTAAIWGGVGRDLLDLRHVLDPVSINEWHDNAGITARVRDFERILGATQATNRIFGSYSDDEIVGGRLNDVLGGMAGNNTVSGGGGNDTLSGGTGNNLYFGGFGNDKILSGAGQATIFGGAGQDDVSAYFTEQSTIWGEGGNDHILGGGGFFDGGSGDDVIASAFIFAVDRVIGSASLNGGEGDDTLRANRTDYVTLDGGIGNDSFVLQYGLGYAANDALVIGGQGNDVVTIARDSYDRIDFFGGEGDDGLDVAGRDMRGVEILNADLGAGNDVVDLLRTGDAILSIYGGDGADIIRTGFYYHGDAFGGADTDTMSTFQVALHGDAGDDVMSSANDGILYGGEGNDHLSGDGQSFFGDGGNDVITITDSTAVFAGEGDDLLILEGTDLSTFHDPKGNYDMFGGAGQDTIQINSGIVALYQEGTTNGVTAFDVIGFETIIFTGGDVLIFDYQGLGDSLYFGDGSQRLDAHVAGETYHLGAGGDSGRVNADDLTIYGEDNGDEFTIDSGRRAILYGGNGNDYFVIKLGAEAFGDSGNDTFNGTGRATVHGGAGSDLIYGGFAGETLYGDEGSDKIELSNGYGGSGAFDVYGGAGSDTVVARQLDASIDLGAGNDTITFYKPLNWNPVLTVAQVTLATGAGSDVIAAGDVLGLNSVTVLDFDVLSDRLSFGFSHISDFDQITESVEGVTLTENGNTFLLLGVTQGELSDVLLFMG